MIRIISFSVAIVMNVGGELGSVRNDCDSLTWSKYRLKVDYDLFVSNVSL